MLEKLKALTLVLDRYSTDILEIQKFFGLIILTGIIYTPNILKHWFTDGLYDTPTFQKLWHVIDFIYFRKFYTSMAKKIPAMISMIGKEAAVTKFAFLPIGHSKEMPTKMSDFKVHNCTALVSFFKYYIFIGSQFNNYILVVS